MCAPCKIILDEEVEGFMAGEDREIALSRAIRHLLIRDPEALSEKVQNAMIRADYWLLQQKEVTDKVRVVWRRRIYDALEQQAGFSFAGD